MTKSLEVLVAEMKTAAEKATSGEWYSDHIETDGTYGNGEDCSEGFRAAGVYTDKGGLIFDTSNSDIATIHEEYDEDGFIAFDETGFKNAEFVVACCPENVLALIAALGQAQALATQQGNIGCALFDEVTQLRQCNAELEARPLCVNPDHAMREVAPLCVKPRLAPHKYRECVNELLEQAIAYAGTQQLRNRLASSLENYIDPDHSHTRSQGCNGRTCALKAGENG